ncbi:MAG TPA: hypothetical protein VNM37_11675, partial [Candidatus Dormibacteraeota bacterium]|nr:hypothetical protein [Candidatus Dormibacteraeota bacterium]
TFGPFLPKDSDPARPAHFAQIWDIFGTNEVIGPGSGFRLYAGARRDAERLDARDPCPRL